jgi:hypothetical protein
MIYLIRGRERTVKLFWPVSNIFLDSDRTTAIMIISLKKANRLKRRDAKLLA